jgi:hypothetical protein
VRAQGWRGEGVGGRIRTRVGDLGSWEQSGFAIKDQV